MHNCFILRPFLFVSMAALFIITGCTKDVTNIKLPETDPKLVVGCFISPQDTFIVVTVSRSNPIFGANHNTSKDLFVKDASVTISDGISSATIPYTSIPASNLNFKNQYELNASLFPILPGTTYHLTVTTPKGENVSASCTVPVYNLSSLTVEMVDTASEKKQINVKWLDIAGQTNYYRIYAEILTEDIMGPTLDTMYTFMWPDNYISILTDAGKDGKEIFARLDGWVGTRYYNNVPYLDKVIAYDVYVMNLTEEYYKYQSSVDKETFNDPFSEPNPAYSNVKGGLGVFCAYQKFHMRKI